jgi:hypothetical protein
MTEPARTVADLSPEERAADAEARRKIDASIPQGPMTTERIGELHAATRPLLEALRSVAQAQATRHGDKPVPADTFDNARTLFANVRRVLSKEPNQRGLYFIHPQLSWVGLLAKLELALAAFRQFHETYGIDDDPDFVDMWRTEQYSDFCFARAFVRYSGNDLGEDDENLSTLDDDDL